jgi:hypothetical protein
VLREAAWGDVLVAYADGERLPGVAALADLLDSVEVTDDAGWRQQADGLGIDPGIGWGQRLLAAGTIEAPDGPVAWHVAGPTLDLARPGALAPDASASAFGDLLVEPCVVFDDGERSCAGGRHGGRGEWIVGAGASLLSGSDGPAHVPEVLMVSTQLPAETLRLTTATGVEEVAFEPIGGTPHRLAVALRGIEGLTCGHLNADDPASEGLVVELVDAAGVVLACVS